MPYSQVRLLFLLNKQINFLTPNKESSRGSVSVSAIKSSREMIFSPSSSSSSFSFSSVDNTYRMSFATHRKIYRCSGSVAGEPCLTVASSIHYGVLVLSSYIYLQLYVDCRLIVRYLYLCIPVYTDEIRVPQVNICLLYTSDAADE